MDITLQWRHNGRDGVSNHQPPNSLLNRLFGRRSKKTSKLRVTGLCAWNSPVTGEFPAQRASNAENVSIWWRHHDVSDHATKRSCRCYRHIIQAPDRKMTRGFKGIQKPLSHWHFNSHGSVTWQTKETWTECYCSFVDKTCIRIAHFNGWIER